MTAASTKEKQSEKENIIELIKGLKEDIEEIKQKPVMNGAFDKITTSIEQMKEQQAVLCVSHKQIESKVNDVYSAIYNPENGIFKKINDSVNNDTEQGKALKEIQEDRAKTKRLLYRQEEEIKDLKETEKELREIAGKRFEKLSKVVSFGKMSGKFILFLGATVLTVIITSYGDTIVKFFSKLF